MPSPVGHLLASLTVAFLLAPGRSSPGSDAEAGGGDADARRPRRKHGGAARWPRVGLAGAAGMAVVAAAGLAPDLDLLIGRHSAQTHSVGAAALAGLAAVVAPVGQRFRFGLAIGLAYATHPLLDWLSEDTSIPRGVMALWPFSSAFYHSGLDWLGATDRRYWLDGFWVRNLWSLAREAIVLGPVTLLAWRLRRRAGRRQPPSAAQAP